ncbi:MAG: hypothetical protein WCP89_00195 [archaeon]
MKNTNEGMNRKSLVGASILLVVLAAFSFALVSSANPVEKCYHLESADDSKTSLYVSYLEGTREETFLKDKTGKVVKGFRTDQAGEDQTHLKSWKVVGLCSNGTTVSHATAVLGTGTLAFAGVTTGTTGTTTGTTTGITPAGSCGNSVVEVDAGEECDGADVSKCKSPVLSPGESYICLPRGDPNECKCSVKSSSSSSAKCGDGVKNGVEECDFQTIDGKQGSLLKLVNHNLVKLDGTCPTDSLKPKALRDCAPPGAADQCKCRDIVITSIPTSSAVCVKGGDLKDALGNVLAKKAECGNDQDCYTVPNAAQPFHCDTTPNVCECNKTKADKPVAPCTNSINSEGAYCATGSASKGEASVASEPVKGMCCDKIINKDLQIKVSGSMMALNGKVEDFDHAYGIKSTGNNIFGGYEDVSLVNLFSAGSYRWNMDDGSIDVQVSYKTDSDGKCTTIVKAMLHGNFDLLGNRRNDIYYYGEFPGHARAGDVIVAEQMSSGQIAGTFGTYLATTDAFKTYENSLSGSGNKYNLGTPMSIAIVGDPCGAVCILSDLHWEIDDKRVGASLGGIGLPALGGGSDGNVWVGKNSDVVSLVANAKGCVGREIIPTVIEQTSAGNIEASQPPLKVVVQKDGKISIPWSAGSGQSTTGATKYFFRLEYTGNQKILTSGTKDSQMISVTPIGPSEVVTGSVVNIRVPQSAPSSVPSSVSSAVPPSNSLGTSSQVNSPVSNPTRLSVKDDKTGVEYVCNTPRVEQVPLNPGVPIIDESRKIIVPQTVCVPKVNGPERLNKVEEDKESGCTINTYIASVDPVYKLTGAAKEENDKRYGTQLILNKKIPDGWVSGWYDKGIMEYICEGKLTARAFNRCGLGLCFFKSWNFVNSNDENVEKDGAGMDYNNGKWFWSWRGEGEFKKSLKEAVAVLKKTSVSPYSNEPSNVALVLKTEMQCDLDLDASGKIQFNDDGSVKVKNCREGKEDPEAAAIKQQIIAQAKAARDSAAGGAIFIPEQVVEQKTSGPIDIAVKAPEGAKFALGGSGGNNQYSLVTVSDKVTKKVAVTTTATSVGLESNSYNIPITPTLETTCSVLKLAPTIRMKVKLLYTVSSSGSTSTSTSTFEEDITLNREYDSNIKTAEKWGKKIANDPNNAFYGAIPIYVGEKTSSGVTVRVELAAVDSTGTSRGGPFEYNGLGDSNLPISSANFKVSFDSGNSTYYGVKTKGGYFAANQIQQVRTDVPLNFTILDNLCNSACVKQSGKLNYNHYPGMLVADLDYSLSNYNFAKQLISQPHGVFNYRRADHIPIDYALSDNPVSLCDIDLMFGWSSGGKESAEEAINAYDYMNKVYTKSALNKYYRESFIWFDGTDSEPGIIGGIKMSNLPPTVPCFLNILSDGPTRLFQATGDSKEILINLGSSGLNINTGSPRHWTVQNSLIKDIIIVYADLLRDPAMTDNSCAGLRRAVDRYFSRYKDKDVSGNKIQHFEFKDLENALVGPGIVPTYFGGSP